MVLKPAKQCSAWRVLCKLIAVRSGLWLGNLSASLVIVGSVLVWGLATRATLDVLAQGRGLDAAALLSICSWLVVAGLGERVGALVQVLTELAFSIGSIADLRAGVLRGLLNRPKDFSRSAMEMASGLAIDAEEIRFAIELNAFTSRILLALIAIAVMLYIEWQLALAAILPFALVSVACAAMNWRIDDLRIRYRRETDHVISWMSELLANAELLQLHCSTSTATNRILPLNAARMRAALREQFCLELLASSYELSSHLATGIMLFLSARVLGSSAFSVGDFSLFCAYFDLLRHLPFACGNFVTRYQQATVAIERLGAVISNGSPEFERQRNAPVRWQPALNARVTDDPNECNSLQSLRLLDISYAARDTPGFRLEQIALDVRAGTWIGITGQLGAGKTTLLQIALGLIPPDTGEVLWNGKALMPEEFPLTPPLAAYAPQAPHLFTGTLRENILLSGSTSEDVLFRAIHAAALDEDIIRLPDGLDTPVGPGGVRLSGGQVQRTAIARALACQPQLLVLDDVSSALDDRTEALLWQRLRSFPVATCLLVSNRKLALEHADQIFSLSDGRLYET
jgi:ATP-binding cassette subfamily B protein